MNTGANWTKSARWRNDDECFCDTGAGWEGTGLTELDENVKSISVDTPYGAPSAPNP